MTQSEEVTTDPLIDEVRSRRRALMASCGDDLNRLLEKVEQLQRQHPDKMVDHRSTVTPRGRYRRT